MALICLAFGNVLSCSAGTGEAASSAEMPTAIHSVRGAVMELEEPQATAWRCGTGLHKQEGVMHLSENHLPKNRRPGGLPKRFPVGTTYVVEGSGGENGHLRVFSRYVVLPGGQRIDLGANAGADFGGNFSGPASPRARSRSRNRSQSQAQNGEKHRPARAKKIMAGGGTPRKHRR